MTLLEAGATAKAAVSTLAMMAAQGTVLALVALLLARAGRLRPAWQAALWLVVLVKFVLPWGPAMPWSLADLFAAWSSSPPADAPIVLQPMLAGPAPAPPVAPAIGWLALAAAWAIGTAFVLGRAVIAHVRVLREARRAVPAPDEARALLRRLAAATKVRAPGLAVGDAATGPYVVGLVRPIIVVPPPLLSDPLLLRAALLHELAHVRRRDALARLVQIAATSLFFFWPVVRRVGRRLDLAREAACDAWALAAGDVPRPAYARLLVRMAALRSAPAHGLASPRTLDARVAAVLGPPARARLGAVHGVALIVWIGVALGGARTATAHENPQVCEYTLALAEALRQAHPEADLDGDGYLSKDEACSFQAETRDTPSDKTSRLDDEARRELDRVLSEPLCCKCPSGDGVILQRADGLDTTCQRSEGVDR